MHNADSQPKAPPHQILIQCKEEYRGIKFFDLLKTLYKNKYSLIAVICTFTLMAVCLAFFIKPQYQITTHLVEPKIDQLKVISSETGSNVNQAELFGIFLKRLNNSQNFKSFLDDAKTVKQEMLLPFKNNLKSKVIINQKGLLREATDDRQNKLTDKISDNGVDAELDILSPIKPQDTELSLAYLSFTNRELLEEFTLKQQDIIKREIHKLESQISIQTDTLKNQLSFKEEKLKNEIIDLNAKKNTQDYKNKLTLLQQKLDNTQYDIKLLTLENKAQDKTLLIQKLQLEKLKTLSFDLSGIQSFQIEGISTIIKNTPNRKLIIILGVFLGILAALVITILQMDMKARKLLGEVTG